MMTLSPRTFSVPTIILFVMTVGGMAQECRVFDHYTIDDGLSHGTVYDI